MVLTKIIFFSSVLLIFYVYLGYPALLLLVAKFKNKIVIKKPFEPFVTILIAAYNEEKHIEATIKNKLELDYPEDKIELIVISDGSTDNTEYIVKQYEKSGVTLLRQIPRAGKTSALNMAVPYAKGDILIFSDANSLYRKDAVRRLVQNFHDPSVGYVTGKMMYTTSQGNPIGDGCTAYMKYENFIRGLETRAGSIVGVDGGIDAVRRNLYRPMRPDQLPDFILPLKVVEQGYRVVYEAAAVLSEPALNKSEDEYKMRVRVSLRALWALHDMRHLLTFATSFLYSWQIWSHKLLRYTCFIFFLATFIANWSLFSENTFYRLCFAGQIFFYLAAIVSFILEKMKHRFRFMYPLHYFVLINFAAAHAFCKFLLGKKQIVWTPRI